ncbi:MAG: patatin-like phospholipase family protein [Chloroflexota bacterium]
MTQVKSAHVDTKAVGLALSGAAVRGFVHIGVMQALEDADITINYVGGSSAGAIIAYLKAAGLCVKDLLDISSQIGWARMVRPAFSDMGVFSFKPLEKFLIQLLGDLHYEDLSTPLVVSTTNLDTGTAVLFNSGRIAPTVHASCAIPGMIKPVNYAGYSHLVDGGVANNTPSNAVKAIGADYVIGVDAFTPHKRRFAGPLGVGINAIEIMVRNSNQGPLASDCLIAPDLSHISFGRFGQKQAMIDIGRREAEKHLDQITAFLRN